jgi:hypothetical protein
MRRLIRYLSDISGDPLLAAYVRAPGGDHDPHNPKGERHVAVTDVLRLSEKRPDPDEEGARILLCVAHSTRPGLTLPDLIDWACAMNPPLRRFDPAVLAGIALDARIGNATGVPPCR